MIGQASDHGRLDPPLLMALDEATQICRVPLDKWLAHSGGKGIQIATVVHGEAQLAATWGHHGRRVILDTSGCKVVLPGVDDPDTLEHLSRVCGEHAFRERGRGERGRDAIWTRYPVMSPSMINQLPTGFALVKWGNSALTIAKIAAARKDRMIRADQVRYRRLPAAPIELPVPICELPQDAIPADVVPDDLAALPDVPVSAPSGQAYPWDEGQA